LATAPRSRDEEIRVVYHISDRLGLAIAKKSILRYFLEKWGGIIGAKTLEAVAVRKIGPRVDLSHLAREV